MKLRKKRVDAVVEENYWHGFFECLYGNESQIDPLEYASTSGYYSYNGIRQIAYGHGVRDCLVVLRNRASERFRARPDREVPARVYAEAYAAARIAMAKSR